MKMLILLFIQFPIVAFGQVISVDKPEIEEQRRFYEQHMTQKIEKTLNTLISSDSYILNVSVRLKNLGLEKISINNEKSNVEKPKLNIQKEFNGEEGLIPLSKLGVWTSQETVEEKQSTQSWSKRIRNFSELIGSVNVDLILDEERIEEPKVRVVRQVVGQLLTGRLSVAPVINVRAMKLGTVSREKEDIRKSLLTEVRDEFDKMKKTIENERQPASIIEESGAIQTLKDFKELIGSLLLTLVLFFLGVHISQNYVKFQEKKLEVEQSIAMKQSESKDGGSFDSFGSERDLIIEKGEGESSDQSGIERLKNMIENQPEKAAYMIKQWLYMDDREMHSVLAFLPAVIPFPALTKILELLSESDRKVWNRVNALADTKMNRAQLDFVLVQKISKHMIEPDAGVDSEVKEFIAGMTPQEAVTCIKSSIDTGALLAITMPSLQYTRVLSYLDSATIKKIAAISGQMDPEKLQTTSIKVQKLLREIRKRSEAQSSAFMEKVPEFIRDLGVGKERAIFESVAEMGQVDYLIEVSKSFFPAELIQHLPPHVVKIGMDSMALKDKAELIAAHPQMSDFLLDCAGTGKMQEIIRVEVDDILADDDRKEDVKRSSLKLLQKFVNNVRTVIQQNDAIQEEVMPVVRQWAQRLSSSGGANAA